jgi:hypothetical protein
MKNNERAEILAHFVCSRLQMSVHQYLRGVSSTVRGTLNRFVQIYNLILLDLYDVRRRRILVNALVDAVIQIRNSDSVSCYVPHVSRFPHIGYLSWGELRCLLRLCEMISIREMLEENSNNRVFTGFLNGNNGEYTNSDDKKGRTWGELGKAVVKQFLWIYLLYYLSFLFIMFLVQVLACIPDIYVVYTQENFYRRGEFSKSVTYYHVYSKYWIPRDLYNINPQRVFFSFVRQLEYLTKELNGSNGSWTNSDDVRHDYVQGDVCQICFNPTEPNQAGPRSIRSNFSWGNENSVCNHFSCSQCAVNISHNIWIANNSFGPVRCPFCNFNAHIPINFAEHLRQGELFVPAINLQVINNNLPNLPIVEEEMLENEPEELEVLQTNIFTKYSSFDYFFYKNFPEGDFVKMYLLLIFLVRFSYIVWLPQILGKVIHFVFFGQLDLFTELFTYFSKYILLINFFIFIIYSLYIYIFSDDEVEDVFGTVYKIPFKYKYGSYHSLQNILSPSQYGRGVVSVSYYPKLVLEVFELRAQSKDSEGLFRFIYSDVNTLLKGKVFDPLICWTTSMVAYQQIQAFRYTEEHYQRDNTPHVRNLKF